MSSSGGDPSNAKTEAGPLRRRLRKRARRFVSGVAGEVASDLIRAQRLSLLSDPTTVGRLVPVDEDEGCYWTLPSFEPSGFDPAIVPPVELRRVGEDFVEGGRMNVDSMKAILGRHGLDLRDADGILDFGCGVGRMIRWLADLAEEQPVWGVDIEVPAIRWAQQHLTPPLQFSTCTTAPHLPFEDRSFGLVYAGSVFTHIEDLADAWLLELRRITRPGGFLFLTVHDQATVQYWLTRVPDDRVSKKMMLRPDLFERLGEDHAVIGDRNWGNVFYDTDYLRWLWGQWLDVVEIVPEAYYNQTAVILRRRPD